MSKGGRDGGCARPALHLHPLLALSIAVIGVAVGGLHNLCVGRSSHLRPSCRPGWLAVGAGSRFAYRGPRLRH